MKYLVVDIGGTFIKYGIIDNQFSILENNKVETPKNMDDFFVTMKKIYFNYMGDIEGIALSMPGRIDEKTGLAYSAGHLTYLNGVNIVNHLHEFINKPISIENDAKCAALAELWLGSLKGINNAVVLVLGTGVGGGIIIDKKVYKGSNSIAGEFSYIAEGKADIFADYIGKKGGVSSLISDYADLKNIDKKDINGEIVFNRVLQGEKEAVRALENYCNTLALLIFNLQHILDPEMFSIGGGISAQSVFIDYLNKAINNHFENARLALVKPVIVVSKYRNESNMLGALINFNLNKIEKR